MTSSYKSYAVIGLGFGDEGKGLVTNALCHSLKDVLVVRYSGGQQAGHTVVLKDGTSHVFANFGSGSLTGVPTYWSKFCTIDPVGIMRELEVLKSKSIEPTLYIDRHCPVTTPYEKSEDRQDVLSQLHGTCGVGVGATFAREEAFYSFTAGDLAFSSVVDIKMELLKDVSYKADSSYTKPRCDHADLPLFFEAVAYLNDSPNIKVVDEQPLAITRVFEGSQGLLLDQHNGFFPHVTRSNTGTKNIVELRGGDAQLFLVTRAYQTRHGKGPMTNHPLPHNIIENDLETNVDNTHQGYFRKSILDVTLLQYAVDRDGIIRRSKNKTLVITCCDQIDGVFRYTLDGKLYCQEDRAAFGETVAGLLGIDKVIMVDDPTTVFDLESNVWNY